MGHSDPARDILEAGFTSKSIEIHLKMDENGLFRWKRPAFLGAVHTPRTFSHPRVGAG